MTAAETKPCQVDKASPKIFGSKAEAIGNTGLAVVVVGLAVGLVGYFYLVFYKVKAVVKLQEIKTGGEGEGAGADTGGGSEGRDGKVGVYTEMRYL